MKKQKKVGRDLTTNQAGFINRSHPNPTDDTQNDYMIWGKSLTNDRSVSQPIKLIGENALG